MDLAYPLRARRRAAHSTIPPATARSAAVILGWLTWVVVLVIVGVTILITATMLGRTQAYLVRQNEAYAKNMALHLNEILAPEFGTILVLPANAPLPDTAQLDQSVSRILHGLNIRQLAIYDHNGRLVYTMQPDAPPSGDAAASALAMALGGDPASLPIAEMLPGSSATSFSLATYVPIHTMNGTTIAAPVRGAFVIEQDLSAILTQLREEQFWTAALVFGMMGLLLAALLFAIRWAGSVLQTQHATLLNRHMELIQLQQAREDLTSLIIHDLRNPLTAIGGYLDLLALNTFEAQIPELVTSARISTRTMQQLISTILDTQRLQDGNLPLARQAIDIAALLRRSADVFCGWAQRDGKRIRLDLAPDLPTLSADPDLLGRIIANLLSNALKHTPDGTTIVLSAQRHARQPHMIVRVSDDGPGIPPQLIPRLFTRYTRGTGEKEGGSSGLGLAFCRLAVEAHGGTIRAMSAPQQGTTFSIRLPLTMVEPKPS